VPAPLSRAIWAQFVACGAEQKLGGRAEAPPHKVVERAFP
jgi:hypothetical protein